MTAFDPETGDPPRQKPFIYKGFWLEFFTRKYLGAS
jgi:hypothetical protein